MTALPLPLAALLAQAGPAAPVRAAAEAATRPAGHFLRFPPHWPDQGELLALAERLGPAPAVLLIAAGIVYLMFGFSAFKALMVLNAAAVGAAVGAIIGKKTGATVPCAVLAGFTAAAVTLPLMKWAVAAMGGVLGGLIGGMVWRTVGLDAQFAWAGAMTGVVGFALLCFILFRGCIMMNTSLQGAGMLIFGLLGLVFKYQDLAAKATRLMQAKPFILPMVLFVCTVLGLMYQQSCIPRPAGPPPGGPPRK